MGIFEEFKKETESVSKPPEAKQLPVVSPEVRKHIAEKLPEIREDITRLNKAFDALNENYPEILDGLVLKHPELTKARLALNTCLYGLSYNQSNLTDQEILRYIDVYNRSASIINKIFLATKKEHAEKDQQLLAQALRGEIPFDENMLTPAEKQQLRQFAQDAWKEIFPDTHVDKLAKWVSKQAFDQNELVGLQKIMLAPANGIEGAVVSFINLFHAKTYQDLSASINIMADMDVKDWCSSWQTLKFTYENLPTADKLAPVISVLTGMVFLFGGASKLFEILDKLNYPAKTKVLLKGLLKGVIATRTGIRPVSSLGKVLPVATVVGVTLKYIDLEAK